MVQPYTPDEFCTVICQDVKGVDINGIRIEESAVWGSKRRPFSAVEQNPFHVAP